MEEKRIDGKLSAEAELVADETALESASHQGEAQSDVQQKEGSADILEVAVERAVQRLKSLYDPYWREEAKKAFKERDEAKRKLRELEANFEALLQEATEAARSELSAEFERRLAEVEAKHMLELRGCVDPDAAIKLLGNLKSVDEVQKAVERLAEEKPYLFGVQPPQLAPLSVRSLRRAEPKSARELRKLAASNYKS